MKILNVKDLYNSKWITMKQAYCVNGLNEKFDWDYISRTGNQKIVIIYAKDNDNHVILNKQYRVPLDKTVLEFPKGIIDIGETIEEAALRELKEETGYTGSVLSVSDQISTCSYLSSELAFIAEVFIDMNSDENKLNRNNTQRSLEISESITPIWVAPNHLAHIVNDNPEKLLISALVLFYLKGLAE